MAFIRLDPIPARERIAGPDGLAGRSWERWFLRVRETVRVSGVISATINPASVAANTTAEQTFTVTGLATDMVVAVNKPSLTAGLGIAGARVSAADTLAVTFINATGAPIDPPSETYTISYVRA